MTTITTKFSHTVSALLGKGRRISDLPQEEQEALAEAQYQRDLQAARLELNNPDAYADAYITPAARKATVGKHGL